MYPICKINIYKSISAIIYDTNVSTLKKKEIFY